MIETFHPRVGRVTAAALIVLMLGAERGHAQVRLEARYTVTVARIPIGSTTWTAEIGSDQYLASAIGETGGMARILSGTKGSMAARGFIREGRLVAAGFASRTVDESETFEVTMALAAGNVTELAAVPPTATAGRVPVTEEHRRGVIDPLTAMLVPVGGTGDLLVAEACARALPIFDGRRRYDLGLAYKRMDTVNAGKGYRGPVIVCAVTFRAIAGHQVGSRLVGYLSGGREMEIWFAPVAGTRVLAPFRLSVASMLGNLVMQAIAFEATPAPAAAPGAAETTAR